MSRNIMKMNLEIVNHTRREIYGVGKVYRKDNRPTPLAMQIDEQPNYEVSYDTLVRLLLSIRNDDVSLQLDDFADPKTDDYRFYPGFEIVDQFDKMFPVEEGWDELS